MPSNQCYSCHRLAAALMQANCGHKICFSCVRANKNTSKCQSCSHYARNRMNINSRGQTAGIYLTPNRGQEKEKEKSTKAKESQNKGEQTGSPGNLKSSRKQLHKSSANVIFSPSMELDPSPFSTILCKEHQEPLTMFCKNTKELICSSCLCQRPKYNQNGDIMPLRGAEEHLRKQNKVQREEARIILSTVQNTQKLMKKNVQVLRTAYDSHLCILEGVFENAKQELEYLRQQKINSFNRFFTNKLQECGQILTDLSYLASILKEHRDLLSKQPSSIQELVYAFTACKVVKSTVKNMDFEYLEYHSPRDLSLIEIRKQAAMRSLEDMVKLKLDMPLRYAEKKRNKSTSNKSANRSKHQDLDDTPPLRQGYTQQLKPNNPNPTKVIPKKHQMSLCGNVGGSQMDENERTVYKMLLKAKFKQ